MADHINRVAGFAWPALTRLADKICLSNKSTYQAVRELESADLLEVARRRKNSNHYRMVWPAGRKPAPNKNPVGYGGRKCLGQRQHRPPFEGRGCLPILLN